MTHRRFARAFKLSLRRGDAMREDVHEELEHHLALSVERLMEMGMSPEEARSEALRRLGHPRRDVEADLYGIARTRERHVRIREWLEGLQLDLRYALRSLVRRPALTVVITGTLALGIGANAAVFPMLDRLLFRPPTGVDDPEELRRFYVLERADQEQIRARNVISYPDYVDLREGLRGIAHVAGYRTSTASVAGDSAAERQVGVAYATSDFLPMLGVRPAMGRFFGDDENQLASPRFVAVVSHRIWKSRLGGDSAVIGRTIDVGGRGFTIIGVTEPGFEGIDLSPVDLWLPLATQDIMGRLDGRWWEARDLSGLSPVARLPATTTDAAIADAATVRYRTTIRELRLRNREPRMQLGSIIEGRGPQRLTEPRRIASRLAGVSIILLLVAIANVINLLLARGVGRKRELAVRRALGVSNSRLVQYFIVEAALFALLAAGAAAVCGALLSGVVRTMLLPDSNWTPPFVDPRAILFTMILAGVCAVVAGAVAAIDALRCDVIRPLKAGGRDGSRGASRIRSGLLIAQAALSVVLLVGAGLFMTSLERVRRADVGFDVDRIAAVNAGPVPREVTNAVRSRLDALPDVEATAISSVTPLRAISWQDTFLSGRDSALAEGYTPSRLEVTPTFFATMGLSIVRGRGFDAAAERTPTLEVVINQEAARVLWPGSDPMGTCVRFGLKTEPCHTVVGIVENARRFVVVEEPALQVYVPLDPQDYGRALLIRGRDDPGAAAAFARREMRALAPDRTPEVFLYRDWLEPQLRPWRLGVSLFSAVAALSLLLAVVGLYSMLAYSVAERSHEIGVRMALGARRSDIVAVVARQAMAIVLVGVLVGLAAAAAAGKAIAALLYDTSTRDPLVYGGVALILLAAGSIAAVVPAMRAGKVDPLEALRAE